MKDKDEKGDRKSQIWLIRANGGEAWKLTDQKAGVRGFEWSAGGSEIFFIGDEPPSDAESAAQKSGDDAIYVDEGPNGQDRARFTHLWVVSIADNRVRQITRDKVIVSSFMPSPDGRRVALTYRRESIRNNQYKTEVATIDVRTGEIVNLTKNEAPEQDVKWSPDGALVSFKAPDDRTWQLAEEKLWVVPAVGGSPRRASDFQGEIARYFWAPDSKSILFGGIERARGGTFHLNVSTGKVRRLPLADPATILESVASDRRTGTGIASSPAAPADAYMIDLLGGRTARVTDASLQIGSLALAQFRSVTWKSQDGLEVEGMLWLPADHQSGSKLPLIVSIHGGPAGVWTASFRGINHVYAGLGWAVIEPNVRGSASYGDPLLRGNMKDIGGGDYQDLMSGVDALIVQGIADPNQLAIRGWSYGGILGGWTITQTSRFKAASLGAMVSDWSSEYAMGFNHDVRLWYISGTPWENPDGYRRQSAYTHIANVTTPTIILHGERDTTDTVGQSMIFYQGLKDRGIPVRFIRFPREPHGFREPHHQRIRDVEEIAWLMKYARGIEWKAPERKEDEGKDRKTTTSVDERQD